MLKYPENKIYLTEPYIVNIVDPCDAPTYIAPPEDLDGTVMRYTLTEPALTFSFDQFFQQPSWCRMTYSYVLGSPLIEPLLNGFNETIR